MSENLTDELRRYYVTDENLKSLLASENVVLDHVRQIAEASQLVQAQPPELPRQLAQRLATVAPQGFGPISERWFHMVQLMDLSGSSDDISDPSKLLARLGGAWLVSVKFCTPNGVIAITPDVTKELAAAATDISVERGGREIVLSDMVFEEFALASKLDFSVDSPTIWVWLRIFSMRFGLVTGGKFSPFSSVVMELQDQIAWKLSWGHRACQHNAPHYLAIGVFALSFAFISLEFANILHPPGTDNSMFEALLTSGLVRLPAKHCTALDSSVCTDFEFATMCNFSLIQQAASYNLWLMMGNAMAAPTYTHGLQPCTPPQMPAGFCLIPCETFFILPVTFQQT